VPSPDAPRPAPLFVTGTDTGVGKTHVSRALLRALVRQGAAPFPLKLIETGCAREGDQLVPADGVDLARAARREDALAQVAPYRFLLPAAPTTAARAEGVTLSFAPLVEHVRAAQARSARVLLEGAGGLLVPIGPEGNFADLSLRLGARVVLVARDALGTLNHTLLTVEALAHRGLPLAAIVLSAVGPEPCPLDHVGELRRLLPTVPVYGPLPWLPGATDDQLADALAATGLTGPSLDALFT
jgi:dethiobiotin synthetase